MRINHDLENNEESEGGLSILLKKSKKEKPKENLQVHFSDKALPELYEVVKITVKAGL